MTFTAGSKLRASDLVAIDSRGTYSKYTSTTSVAAGGTTVLVPTLSQGSGTGLSLVSNLFTLSNGIWYVDFNLEYATGVGTTVFLNLVISSNTTASIPTGWLAGGTGSGNATTGFLDASASTKILSDGTATVAFKVFSPSSGPSGVPGGVSMTFVRGAIV